MPEGQTIDSQIRETSKTVIIKYGRCSRSWADLRTKNNPVYFSFTLISHILILILVLVLVFVMRLAAQTCIYVLTVYSPIWNAFQLMEKEFLAHILVCTCASRMRWYRSRHRLIEPLGPSVGGPCISMYLLHTCPPCYSLRDFYPSYALHPLCIRFSHCPGPNKCCYKLSVNSSANS